MTTTPTPHQLAARDQLLAGLDAESAPVPPCPSWCYLRPGHGWDSIHDDGRRGRGHGGPSFGKFVGVGSIEYDDRTVDGFGIDVGPEIAEGEILTAPQARRLAGDLVAAAEWLEAHS